MGKLFAMDGKLLRLMNKAADLVFLNVLWLVCCIPIVTIGASTTAFQYVILKMARDEESYVCSTFFRAFKENFKQSTIVWGVFLFMGIVLYFDFYYSGHTPEQFGKFLFIPLAIAAFLLLSTMFYAFPILAFFQNSTKKVFKNSFYMAVAHLPYTFAIIIVNLLPVLLLFMGNVMAAGFIDVIIGFAMTAWINAHIFRKLFDKYI